MKCDWTTSRLDSFVAIKGGKRLPKGVNLQVERNTHPYIRIRDLGSSKTLELTSNYEYVDDITQKTISRYIVNNGDILISIVGTIGLVGIVGESLDCANLTENCVKLVNIKGIDRDYLYYYLISQLGQNEIKKGTVGAVQPKLPIKNIQSISINYPKNIETQKKIASILSKIDNKIELNNKINNNLEQQAMAYYAYPTDDEEYAIEFDEEDLTDILIALVCSENLASRIDDMELNKYLIMGKGDIRNNVQDDDSVKEDLFEAIVGAVTMDLDWKHVDKNGIGRWDIEKLKKVVSKMLNLKESLPQIIEDLQEDYSFEDEVGQPDENRAINQLNELYQKGLICEPIYDYEQDYDDDDGTPIWRCYCRIKGDNKTSYWTNSKKDAKRDASYRMLCYLMDYKYEE